MKKNHEEKKNIENDSGRVLKKAKPGLFPACLAVLYCLVLYLAVPAEAQQRRDAPWWYTLEEGKRHFRSGRYGEALRCFEDARENRRRTYAKMEQDLVTLLSIHEVRRLKDDLALVEVYIEKEFRTDAAAALAELYYRVPKDSLRNSAAAALSQISKLKNYPEAEYWIGESYRLEGEFSIALGQYQKAYGMRELLETPEFAAEILYRTAYLSRLQRDYTAMVKSLEEILAEDSLWTKESFNRAAMQRTLENNGINRFLLLYRHNSPAFEKAHRELGLYYYSYGRHGRAAEHLLFAFLIQNTVIIEALKKDQYNFTFRTLEALLEDAQKKRELAAFMDETEYFRTLYYLANSFYGGGKNGPAREIWTFLRDHGRGEWRGRALNQLRNPALDKIPEESP